MRFVFMSEKILNILTRETGGKSYKSHKYSMDNAERTSIEYSEHDKQITWKKTAETQPNRSYVDIEPLGKKIKSNKQILNYFLDGSRRVFKVDENSYPDSNGRSKIYPIISGQIGVACCHRKEREMIPEKFKRELVIAVPDIANADGKSGFFPAIVKKVNDSSRLKEIKLNLASILQYKTNNEEKKI